MSEAVTIASKEPVLWISINRPARRNAINEEVIAGISDGIMQAENNSAINAIVLTGAGVMRFVPGAI